MDHLRASALEASTLKTLRLAGAVTPFQSTRLVGEAPSTAIAGGPMLHAFLSLSIVAFLVASSGTVAAQTAHYYAFDATITSVNDQSGHLGALGFETGDSISGRFWYETSPQTYVTNQAGVQLDGVQVSEGDALSGAQAALWQFGGAVGDPTTLAISQYSYGTPVTVNGIDVSGAWIDLFFFDETGDDGSGLPASLSLPNIESAWLDFFLDEGGAYSSFDAQITALHDVPELDASGAPAAIVLMLGVALLWADRKRLRA